jgi:porphyrinogen peroxidase
MYNAQPRILSEGTKLARYLSFSVKNADHVKSVLMSLKDNIDPSIEVVGFGHSMLKTIGVEIAEHGEMPSQMENGINVPSNPVDILVWLRGDDRGKLFIVPVL